jgi:hypothetical protein
MTVIRNNSISGINSITAQSGALNFYDSTGNTLAISADVTGGVTVATGATISGSTNTITASTNGSERLRINSSGYIGIGTDNPAEEVHINGSTPSIRLTDTAGSNLITRITNSNGDLYFDANFGGSGNIYLRTVSGNVVVNSGNLVFSTAGKGIDFSATSDAGGMTSELLDDYEEGTFADPEIVPASGSFSSVTYDGDTAAKYIKIGNIVHYWGTVRWTAFSVGTGSGTLKITAPFQVAPRQNGDDSDNVGATIVPVWSGTGTAVPTTIQAQNGVSLCILRATRHDAISVVLQASDVGSTGMIAFSITYRTP